MTRIVTISMALQDRNSQENQKHELSSSLGN